MGAFYPTGYLDFIKALELIGGLLVMLPLTRRAGLLILGPIIVNILAFHVFVLKCEKLADPMLILLILLALFLVWAERQAFITFLRGSRT